MRHCATLGLSCSLQIGLSVRDANVALTTILWGNVAINLLLTLLAESVLAGVAAFLSPILRFRPHEKANLRVCYMIRSVRGSDEWRHAHVLGTGLAFSL